MTSRHTVVAMVGFVLAAAFTASTSAETDKSPRSGSPRSGDIDAKPYLAVGFAQSPQQAILLQRMQASCPSETKRALMVDKHAPLAWFGCWRERNGKVEIAFEDGDFLALEHDTFTWLPEAGA